MLNRVITIRREFGSGSRTMFRLSFFSLGNEIRTVF